MKNPETKPEDSMEQYPVAQHLKTALLSMSAELLALGIWKVSTKVVASAKGLDITTQSDESEQKPFKFKLELDIQEDITERDAIRLTFYYQNGTHKEITVVGFEVSDPATTSLTPATAETFSQLIREALNMPEASGEPTGLKKLRHLIDSFNQGLDRVPQEEIAAAIQLLEEARSIIGGTSLTMKE